MEKVFGSVVVTIGKDGVGKLSATGGVIIAIGTVANFGAKNGGGVGMKLLSVCSGAGVEVGVYTK